MAYIVETKLLKATETLGERIEAFVVGNKGYRETVGYDYGRDAYENHYRTAVSLTRNYSVMELLQETARGYRFQVSYEWETEAGTGNLVSISKRFGRP